MAGRAGRTTQGRCRATLSCYSCLVDFQSLTQPRANFGHAQPTKTIQMNAPQLGSVIIPATAKNGTTRKSTTTAKITGDKKSSRAMPAPLKPSFIVLAKRSVSLVRISLVLVQDYSAFGLATSG